MTSQADPAATPAPGQAEPYRLVLVSGGTSSPSSTRMLGDQVAQAVIDAAGQRGVQVTVSTIDLRQLAGEITTAVVSQLLGPGLTHAVELLRAADGVIAATPVYKASSSGLFSSFFDVLDDDLLIGKPVVLAATAGSARHALVIDDQLRGLFAYMRALPVPTAVFAASEDWNSAELGTRVARAAFELLLLIESGFARQIRASAWGSYQHEYGSDGGAEIHVDLSSDLMRLAAGGQPS